MAASAGKNASIASSATVMSTAVPNVVMVLKKDSSRSPADHPQRHHDLVGQAAARLAQRRRRVAAQLLVQSGQRRIPGHGHLPLEPREEVLAPLRQVEDARGHALGMERHAQGVHGRLHQVRRHALGEQRHAAVSGEQLPLLVHHRRRVGLVPAQHQLDRLAHRLHLRVVERALPVDRRVTGRQEHLVALAQRHLELLGEVQHHVRAGPRAAGLEEAQVSRGHARVERQVELAETAPPAPVAQQCAHVRLVEQHCHRRRR